MNSFSRYGRISIKQIAIAAVFGALLIVSQLMLSALANIELVTTLIMLEACVFGPIVFLSIAVFVVAEGLIFGFGIWWISYLYIWLIPAVIGIFMKKVKNPFVWGAVSAVYGLLFGTFTSFPYIFIGGPAAMFAYIIAGIPFDLLHCIGNAVLTTSLFVPLRFVLEKCKTIVRV